MEDTLKQNVTPLQQRTLQREFRSINITEGAPTSCTLQQVTLELQGTHVDVTMTGFVPFIKRLEGFCFLVKGAHSSRMDMTYL